MTRVRRSALAVMTGFLGTVIVTLTGFFTTPILLRTLGAERFGVFRTAMDWFGYVGLLEFGISGALVAVFSRSLGTDHREGVTAGVRAGMRAYLWVGLAMLALASLLGLAMPGLIRAPGDLSHELRMGCAAYLLGYLFMPLATFRPLVEAEQRGYIVQVANTAQMLLAMGLSVGLAAAGWGLVGQFLAPSIGSAAFLLALAWDSLRRHPEIVRGPSSVSPALWSMSWPLLLFHLSGRLSLFTDNIVLAAVLGPAAVTPFALTQRLIQAAGAQATGIGTAGWAGLIDLYYRGEREVFARRLTQLTRVTAIAGAALLLPIAIWNRDLIVLWVGRERYAGPAVTWLATMNAWGQAIFSLWMWPLAAGGRVRALLPSQLVGVSVNLAASIAGTMAFGLPGPLLGTSVVFVGISWWWLLRLLHREFGVARAPLLGAVIRPALVAAAYGTALCLLAEVVPAFDADWPRWAKWSALAGWLAGSAWLFLVLAWLFALPSSDRAEWAGRLRGWLRRPSNDRQGHGEMVDDRQEVR